jgi:hypothetical protein
MTTDLQVLDQACRNTRGFAWKHRVQGELETIEWGSSFFEARNVIVREYKRLMRLKNSKRGKYRAQA